MLPTTWPLGGLLGDPTRRRIPELLADGEQSAGDIIETLHKELGISRSAVSQQRVLRDACTRAQRVKRGCMPLSQQRRRQWTSGWSASVNSGRRASMRWPWRLTQGKRQRAGKKEK